MTWSPGLNLPEANISISRFFNKDGLPVAVELPSLSVLEFHAFCQIENELASQPFEKLNHVLPKSLDP